MSGPGLVRPVFLGPPPGALGPPPWIDVWRVALRASGERLAALESLLTADERARASRFATEALRRRFVARRGATTEILARHLGCEPTGIAYQASDRGRRRLAGPHPPLEFSVADSDDLALVAVAAARSSSAAEEDEEEQVGVDVERVRPVADAEGVAREWLSGAARARIDALAGEAARRRAFFAEWTRVEAAAKALGVGLAGVPERRDEVERLAAAALAFAPDDDVVAALVPGQRPSEVRWWDAAASLSSPA